MIGADMSLLGHEESPNVPARGSAGVDHSNIRMLVEWVQGAVLRSQDDRLRTGACRSARARGPSRGC